MLKEVWWLGATEVRGTFSIAPDFGKTGLTGRQIPSLGAGGITRLGEGKASFFKCNCGLGLLKGVKPQHQLQSTLQQSSVLDGMSGAEQRVGLHRRGRKGSVLLQQVKRVDGWSRAGTLLWLSFRLKSYITPCPSCTVNCSRAFRGEC